jgi:hypothetical protein
MQPPIFPLVFPVGEIPSLIEALKAVPDFRSRHGRRYPLYAILALGIAAMLCGYNSYGAMAEWGTNYGKELAQALGFKEGKTPSVGTLFTVFSRVDKQALLAVLTAWGEQVLTASGKPVALAVDGKTLRGTRKQGAIETHVLSAVSQHLGLTLGQQAMTSKESEITAMQELLCGLVLSGRVVTMDALLTQKSIARQIVDKGGSL